MDSNQTEQIAIIEQLVYDLADDSVEHSILTRLAMSGDAGCELAKGWEEAYFEEEQCWYRISDPEDLRSDAPTVRLMAAEELIAEKSEKIADKALPTLFDMLHDPYEPHRFHHNHCSALC